MSKIDWEKRIIIGKSGTVYKIMVNKVSLGRWPKMEFWGTLVTARMDSDTFIKTGLEIKSKIRKVETLGQLVDIYILFENFFGNILRYNETGRSQLSEYVSLFAFKTDKNGEILGDVGDIDEDTIRENHNDWKEIPYEDFFFLAIRHIPNWQENYRKELERSTGLNE